MTLCQTCLELKAQVEKMRDGYIALDASTDLEMQDGDLARDIAKEMLNSTPESSLSEHDKEVEIKVLDELFELIIDSRTTLTDIQDMIEARRK